MDPHFEGVIFQTHAQELKRRIGHDHPPFRLLDVRSASAFAAGHIEGAISAPDGVIGELPEGSTPATEFLIVGAGPGDAAVRQASMELQRLGATRRVEFGGGMEEWLYLGFPVVGSAARAA